MTRYAKQARDTDVAVQMAELWILARRKAGALLKEMAESGERDAGGRGRIESRPAIQLSALGISLSQAFRWQQIAKVPEKTVEQYVAECIKKKQKRPTNTQR